MYNLLNGQIGGLKSYNVLIASRVATYNPTLLNPTPLKIRGVSVAISTLCNLVDIICVLEPKIQEEALI